MIQKIVLVMLIPVFIILYIASGNGNTTFAFIGVLSFVLLTLSQII